MQVASSVTAFVGNLPSAEQDRFWMFLQTLTKAPSEIEGMETELEKLRAEIARVNDERTAKGREQDYIKGLIAKLDKHLEGAPRSVELRLLRLVLSQKEAKLEEEIGILRPYKSLQRKCALRREIGFSRQMAEIMALMAEGTRKNG